MCLQCLFIDVEVHLYFFCFVDILLNLMTIEAQSYGPGALVGIKVVEHADPDAVAVPQQAHPPQQAATLTPRQPQPMRPFPGPHATPPPQQAMQHQQTTPQHTNSKYSQHTGCCLFQGSGRPTIGPQDCLLHAVQPLVLRVPLKI